MRPLKLTVSGFMPFREQADIDFSDLELFAIQGATGSGKSSLLDAITFALYGETDRLGLTGLDALISSGERTLAVDLTFESGAQTYRVVRTKGRRQAENQVRLEERSEQGKWQNVSDNTTRQTQRKIERALGLDFKSFTRAVMLPQGKFDALLRGTKSERQKLLGELTDLGHVAEMHSYAAERTRTYKFQLASEQAVLDNEYAGVTATALNELRQEKDTLETTLLDLIDEQASQQAELSKLRAQEELHRQLVAAQAQQAALEARSASVQADAQRAARARQVINALPLVIAAEQAQAAYRRAEQDQQAAAQTAQRAAAAQAEAAQRTDVAYAAQQEGQAHHAAELERVEQLAQVKPLWQAQERAAQNAQRAEAAVARAQQAADTTGQGLSAAQQALSAARSAQERAGELEQRAVALQQAEADAKKLRLSGGTLQTTHPSPLPWDEEQWQLASAAAHKLEQLRLDSSKLSSERAALTAGQERWRAEEVRQRQELEEQERLSADGRTLNEQFGRASQAYDKAQEQSGLASYRQHLHLGDTCPLCEQAVLTLPSSSGQDLSVLSAERDALAQRLEALRERFRTLRAETTTRKRKLEDDQRQLSEWDAALLDRARDLQAAQSKLSGQESEDALRLLAGLAERVRRAGRDPAAERQALISEVAALRRAADTAASVQATAAAQHAAAQATLSAAKQTQQEHADELRRSDEVLQGALTRLNLSATTARNAPDPAEERRRLNSNLQALQAALDTARQQQAQASSAAAAANATLSAAQTRFTERAQEAQRAAGALRALLSALGLSAEEVSAAALPEEEIVALEAQQRRHLAEVEQRQTEVDTLRHKLDGVTFDPQQLVFAAREHHAAETRLSEARRRSGELAEALRHLTERLKRRTDLEAHTAELAHTHDRWSTLGNTLRANEFQQYLLQDIERRLLSGAGALLHTISDERYRLTLEDGEYMVQDLWNTGETRAVKTLSGGETFLASLSLAIALSDYLAGNRRLGALFLDEGFGTLDPQALDSVASALENLRTQGRMVGVITHVESLSERLPSRLLVSKSVAGSSVQRLDS